MQPCIFVNLILEYVNVACFFLYDEDCIMLKSKIKFVTLTCIIMLIPCLLQDVFFFQNNPKNLDLS